MDIRSFLRLSASSLLVAALASSCSDDPPAARDVNADEADEDEGETSSTKRDAGRVRDAGKADAKARPSEEEEEEPTDEEEEEEEEVKPRDAGKRSDAASGQCKADSDCRATRDAGIACCDLKTSMCFMTREDECPLPEEDGEQMPTYN
ncbi:MAG: hypothetical protein ABW352_22755 [Polyangiales bacterium]